MCSGCLATKPIEEFAPDPRYAGGRARWCHDCRRAYDAARKRRLRAEDAPYAQRVREAKRSPEHHSKEAVRLTSPEQRERRRRAMQTYRASAAGKLRQRARMAVLAALQRGALIRPDRCDLCGRSPGRGRDGGALIRADHHLGYDEPRWLDVRWVCAACDGRSMRTAMPLPRPRSEDQDFATTDSSQAPPGAPFIPDACNGDDQTRNSGVGGVVGDDDFGPCA